MKFRTVLSGALLLLAPAACASARPAQGPVRVASPASPQPAHPGEPRAEVAAPSAPTVAPTPAPAAVTPAPSAVAPAAVAPAAAAEPPKPAADPSKPAEPGAATARPEPAPPPPLAISIADELPHQPVSLAPRAAPDPRARPGSNDTKPAAKPSKKASKKRGKQPRHATSTRPYHPDPGIIIDVASVQGAATQADVQRIARAKGYGTVRACYEEGLRRNQQLAGRVAVELTLQSDGTVQNAHKTSTTLSDDNVALCVAREIGRLHLADAPKSPSADAKDLTSSTVTMNVSLAVGDEQVAVQRPAPHADKLRDVLRGKLANVEACYKTGLERRRDIGGRLNVRVRATKAGEIVETGEWESRFPDVEVTRCVLSAVKAAKLPRLGRETVFIYPIHLESTPKVAGVVDTRPGAAAAKDDGKAEPRKAPEPPKADDKKPRRRAADDKKTDKPDAPKPDDTKRRPPRRRTQH